jgi:hypothetical protein
MHTEALRGLGHRRRTWWHVEVEQADGQRREAQKAHIRRLSDVIHQVFIDNPLDAPLLGLLAEVLQGDGVKVLQKSRRCPLPDVSSHAMYGPLAASGCCFVVAKTEYEIEITLGGPDNIADLDLLRCPGQIIASRRPPDALDDSSSFQLLEDLFDIPGGDALPG